ncbi:MAG: hypothetical protein RIR18_1405 [Pseudomonadota bacterium]|jgi:diguanylate cyclase (GGDEF)-like protein
MINSLYQRLMLTTLLPACVLVLVLAAYFAIAGLRSMEGQLFLHGQDIVRYMAPSSEYGVLSGNRQALQNMVQVAMEQRDVRGAAIVSTDGQISAMSGRLSLDTGLLTTPPRTASKIAHGDGWVTFAAPILRTTTDEDSLFQLYLSTKTPQQSEIIGQIILELDTSQLLEKQKELVFQGLAIVIPAFLIFAVFAARMAKALILPILRLSDAAKEMAEGNIDTRVPETSKDEIGYLERGFNHMVDQVSEVHRTLHQRIDEATAQLAYQARHDPLTGLINRREFETRLEAALDMAQAGGTVCSVLFIDLDRFKKVNDVAGHMAGDELLRRISRQLHNRIRDTDTLARLGGDEFAVLLNDCPTAHAQTLADSLCHLVAAYHFPWEDKVFTIGASIGLVEVDKSYQSVVDVLGAGDVACYAAKAAGKNRVEVFRQSNNNEYRTREVLGRNLLEKAIANDSLKFETVPVHPVTATTDEASTVKLIELQGILQDSAEDQAVYLSLMMETAERCELAHLFDQRLLTQSAHLLKRANNVEQYQNATILLRISSASLRHPDFLNHLQETLNQLGSSASDLCLLVCEESSIHFPLEVKNLSTLLRQFGCQMGLDDFGGWMGSFNHLQKIKPDFVRIAATLTRDISNQRGSIALVRAIQEIAHENQCKTIANGICDDADRLCLEKLGVNFLQSKPTSLAQ